MKTTEIFVGKKKKEQRKFNFFKVWKLNRVEKNIEIIKEPTLT